MRRAAVMVGVWVWAMWAPGTEARADDAPPPDPPHVDGPKRVDLGYDVDIDLPAGMKLFERDEAQRLLREGGDDPSGVIAAIVQPGSPLDYSIIVAYDDAGHISDDDADQLDASALLTSYREGTDTQNATRRSMGVPELTIDRWTDEPRYLGATHQLAWGLLGHDTKQIQFVNSFTRTLGRTGYLSINVVAAPEQIAAAQSAARPVIDAIRFRAGARYEDYDPHTDKSSGIGLTGLIVGGAAVTAGVKTGFFIKLLLILKKLIIVIAAAIAGFFRWLFRRKPKAATPAPDAAPPDAAGPG